jgi:hypothetical protein
MFLSEKQETKNRRAQQTKEPDAQFVKSGSAPSVWFAAVC